MEFSLAITSLIETDAQGVDRRSGVTAVVAELGPDAGTGSPDFFFGELLHVPAGDILYFKFAPNVKVGFRGSEYRFEELEKSGAFKLVRHPR
jgi:hypothetical protein